jgi:hypothetical protein
MTENSSPEVGRAVIDAYLDSVEQALLAARAPRSDRMQVLQDLDSQIADMLAREPAPITEESVRAVIEKLEPPSHFAETYGDVSESKPWPTRRLPRFEHINWPIIAAVSFALIPISSLVALLDQDLLGALSLIFLLPIGFLFTPFAIWKAFKQIRAQPRDIRGRDLVLNTTAAYAVLVPVLVVLFAIAVTEGIAFYMLGVGALIYVHYVFIRRFWRYMADALPPQPAAASTGKANGNGTNTSISAATPMPAM